MKKQILVFATIIGLLLVGLFPCYGNEKPDYETFTKGYGQSEDLKKYKNFPDLKKGHGKKSSEDEAVVHIYVNCETGKDKPNYGSSTKKPFKTISYAISRVPFMRDSPDFTVDISIAAGTYNEFLVTNLDNIRFVGEGSDSTHIIGSEDQLFAIIVIGNSKKIEINGLNVDGGINAIFAYSYSDLFMVDSSIKNSSIGMGIWDSNITIQNCEISNNSFFGIRLSDNSNVRFSGDISIISDTFSWGKGIQLTMGSNLSTGHAYPVNLTISGYAVGLDLEASTSGLGYDILITDCNIGINVRDESYLNIGGNTECSNNGIGVAVSNATLNIANALLVDNNNFVGVQVDRDGAINTNFNGSFRVENNPTGLQVADGNINLIGGGNYIFDNDQDIDLSFGTRATFNGDNTIGSINCDDTVLIRGNQTCP